MFLTKKKIILNQFQLYCSISPSFVTRGSWLFVCNKAQLALYRNQLALFQNQLALFWNPAGVIGGYYPKGAIECSWRYSALPILFSISLLISVNMSNTIGNNGLKNHCHNQKYFRNHLSVASQTIQKVIYLPLVCNEG